jgi:hypothetical protein
MAFIGKTSPNPVTQQPQPNNPPKPPSSTSVNISQPSPTLLIRACFSPHLHPPPHSYQQRPPPP